MSSKVNKLTRREALKMLGIGAGTLAASLAAGCASAPTAAPAAAPTAAPAAETKKEEPTAAPAAPAGGATISLWSMQYPPHDAAWDMLTKEFNSQNPGVTVKVEPQADWLTKYAAGLSAGTAGDLMSIHGAGVQNFIATKRLLPITEPLGGIAEIKKRFFPAVMDYYSYHGESYGIPLHNNTPGIGMITNLEVWEKAKMTPPDVFKDWAETWDMAKKLTVTDAGKVVQAGLSMRNGHNIQYLCGAILEQGGKYFDDQSGKWSLQTPEAKKALTELFYDPVFTHKVDSAELPECFDGLAQGRMAMGGIWIDYIPYGRIAFPDKRFGFTMRAPLAGNKAIVVGEGGWGLNVNAAAKDKDNSIKFIKFLNQDAVMLEWLKSQHSLPCVYSLLEDPWFSSESAKFLIPALKTVKDWVWMGAVGSKYAMDDIFAPIYQAISLGTLTVDAALVQAEQQLTEKVQSFREETGWTPG